MRGLGWRMAPPACLCSKYSAQGQEGACTVYLRWATASPSIRTLRDSMPRGSGVLGSQTLPSATPNLVSLSPSGPPVSAWCRQPVVACLQYLQHKVKQQNSPILQRESSTPILQRVGPADD